MSDALSAMNHSTATFVVQKLIEVADSSSMEMFVSNVEKNFAALSLNPAGCRVVQKCIQMANPQQQINIVLQLENYKTIVSLLRNKHGTYVAQVKLSRYSFSQFLIKHWYNSVRLVFPLCQSVQ